MGVKIGQPHLDYMQGMLGKNLNTASDYPVTNEVASYCLFVFMDNILGKKIDRLTLLRAVGLFGTTKDRLIQRSTRSPPRTFDVPGGLFDGTCGYGQFMETHLFELALVCVYIAGQQQTPTFDVDLRYVADAFKVDWKRMRDAGKIAFGVLQVVDVAALETL